MTRFQPSDFVIPTTKMLSGLIWDVTANLVQRKYLVVPGTETYGYDFLDRMTSAGSVRDGLNSGLIGWWKLDEGTQGTANDSSGAGNNGTINNARWTTGKSGICWGMPHL